MTIRLRVGAAAVAAAVLGAGMAVGIIGGAAPAASDTPTSVSFVGHGFGHGRGMGQYGSLGYAVDKGWSYHQILDHYYGGTTAGTVAAGTVINVDITDRDAKDTTVVQERGELTVPGYVTCAGSSPCAVKVLRMGPGAFEVFRGTACDGGAGGWTLVAQNIKATTLPVVATVAGSDNRSDMLQLCETNGRRWFRGDIWAIETGTTQATVNHLPVEAYLRGVVPRESPASWGSMGNGSGEQALLTQAVAARSYALASTYAPYASTCDTTACQVYGGRAFADTSGNVTDLEGTALYANSDAAVARTAGEVRVPAGGGGPVRTEFSSSTGGFTAGGQFPAVADDGDATASNPNHSWSVQVPVSAIQAAYGAGRGTYQSISINGRDGNGDLGGRVLSMTIHFSLGDAATTGAAFAGALGLRSSWFAVTSGSAPAPQPTTPTPAASGYHVLTVDGSVYGFGSAPVYGSFAAASAHTTAVSLGEIHGGYWVLAGNGTVHPFGAASDHGSLGGKALNAAPFQIAPSATGGGYWIVAFDGGVFSYGDATFYGSTGAIRLNRPVVGMAATPTGHGYWLVASDGGIFSFGDAIFYGSTGAIRLNQPIVAMAVTPTGHGYWLIAQDGGVFSFGDARYAGSLPGSHINEQAVALASPAGGGYLVATSAGHVYGFGTTPLGGPADRGAGARTIGLTIPR